MAGKTELNKMAAKVATDFFTAVQNRKDWKPYAQLRAREMHAAPNIPTFTTFNVITVQNPDRGEDPDVHRLVLIELTLAGDEFQARRIVRGRVIVVKECNWSPCPECEGDGQVGEGDDTSSCATCGGIGRIAAAMPRIPVKGSDTYEHDMEHGVWGVSPGSFEFLNVKPRPVTK